jgi:hypothetical protein
MLRARIQAKRMKLMSGMNSLPLIEVDDESHQNGLEFRGTPPPGCKYQAVSAHLMFPNSSETLFPWNSQFHEISNIHVFTWCYLQFGLFECDKSIGSRNSSEYFRTQSQLRFRVTSEKISFGVNTPTCLGVTSEIQWEIRFLIVALCRQSSRLNCSWEWWSISDVRPRRVIHHFKLCGSPSQTGPP